MRMKSPWFIALILSGLLAACGSIPSAHAGTTQHPQRTLSASAVAAALSKNDPAEAIADVHIISEKVVPGHSFAYASYKANGASKYAAILASAHGADISTFWLKRLSVTPLQAVELSDGTYILIAGGVFNHPPVRTIVLTFPNGRVAVVPVSHERFWYFHQVGKSKANRFFKHVMGVSTTGDIIQNHRSSKSQGSRGHSS